MPYVGRKIDKRLLELKQRQTARIGDVAAANKREENKLSSILSGMDEKHEKRMVHINTKLFDTRDQVNTRICNCLLFETHRYKLYSYEG